MSDKQEESAETNDFSNPVVGVNRAIWDKLMVTNPNFTKPITGKSFRGTAINGVYVAMRLTELFGPCGKGWGYLVDKDEFVKGSPILIEGNHVADWVVHRVMVRLWWTEGGVNEEGQKTTFKYFVGPCSGQTDFVGRNKNGLYTDEEAPKKSLTDALGKCAFLLGCGADIYSGQYDDNKYVASLRQAYGDERGSAPKADLPIPEKEAGNGHKAPEEPADSATEDKLAVINDYLGEGGPRVRQAKIQHMVMNATNTNDASGITSVTALSPEEIDLCFNWVNSRKDQQ